MSEMAHQSLLNIDDLLNKSSNTIDELFKEAFNSFKPCSKRLAKLCSSTVVSTTTPAAENKAGFAGIMLGLSGVGVSTPTPAAENNTGFVWNHKNRGWTHQVFPFTPIPMLYYMEVLPPLQQRIMPGFWWPRERGAMR